ncbi:hypothetical protein KL921_000786 [Ogataea angusta]|uniref:Eukaryotic translation initiation factor 3 subunit E n=1 Tax=Pichia angusta TaxID=870730 RepID=A0AAN6DJL4_PICAN|nr:uncharacterized protein KL928_000953 [Ogataea angusta]KAG7813240.1 hypothetical protein KL921_000786 [Ogataea angusta]KAG7820869.1 hypothetical protein KL928_000953 [Ogataea angusta]KAG7831823.1 hypothetical protein KL920_000158 [Ogataea angusta]KAG7835996.1 hypothetical protein KL943_001645 [Ogataea angusta]KAG7843062.1 hypothetical protein KL942_000158 [Ogataea angusta]
MTEQTTQHAKLTAQEVEIARKYDLTPKFIQFLDRHLIFPLVENLDSIYPSEEVDSMEFDLLKDTNMTKFIREKYSSLHPGEAIPADLEKKEKAIEEEYARLNAATNKTLEILASKDVQESLKQDKTYNREYLSKNHHIDDAKILELYNFGKFQYNRGDYVVASDLLNNFRLLSVNQDLNLSATWGKISSEIITESWTDALEELNKLREIIDNRHFKGSTLDQLNKRTWLIHFSLFIFFNLENGLENLVDLFFSSSYLSTIQASCPWILRYLVVAVINSKPQSRQKKIKDLVRAVQTEEYEYQDPFTKFVEILFVTYELDKLPAVMKQFKVLATTDFFIGSLDVAELYRNAQVLVLDTIGKLYKVLSVEQLKEFLNDQNIDIALARDNFKLENDKVLIRGAETGSVYQQVYDKTKAFNFKTNQLLNNAFSINSYNHKQSSQEA